MSKQKIYLLLGQKGSGKSFIGAIMEKRFGITFIRVEDWAKQIKKDRAVDDEVYLKEVFEAIEKGVRESLKKVNELVFESTGLTVHFDRMLQRLKKDFHVIAIGIFAHSKTCLERVANRDQTIHINLSDDKVIAINDKVREKNIRTDYQINNESIGEEMLVDDLEKIIKLEQKRAN